MFNVFRQKSDPMKILCLCSLNVFPWRGNASYPDLFLIFRCVRLPFYGGDALLCWYQQLNLQAVSSTTGYDVEDALKNILQGFKKRGRIIAEQRSKTVSNRPMLALGWNLGYCLSFLFKGRDWP